jgi:hypothetical protein
MSTADEIRGQAEKAGKLPEETDDKVIPSETQRSEAPAIPYGNPLEANDDEPPETPPVSSFA